MCSCVCWCVKVLFVWVYACVRFVCINSNSHSTQFKKRVPTTSPSRSLSAPMTMSTVLSVYFVLVPCLTCSRLRFQSTISLSIIITFIFNYQDQNSTMTTIIIYHNIFLQEQPPQFDQRSLGRLEAFFGSGTNWPTWSFVVRPCLDRQHQPHRC